MLPEAGGARRNSRAWCSLWCSKREGRPIEAALCVSSLVAAGRRDPDLYVPGAPSGRGGTVRGPYNVVELAKWRTDGSGYLGKMLGK